MMDDLSVPTGLAEFGREEEAIAALREIVLREPENIPAWLLLGRLLADPEESRDCYRRVLERDPANTDARAFLDVLPAPAPPPGDEDGKPPIRRTWTINGVAILAVMGIISVVLLGYMYFFAESSGPAACRCTHANPPFGDKYSSTLGIAYQDEYSLSDKNAQTLLHAWSEPGRLHRLFGHEPPAGESDRLLAGCFRNAR
jgi:tetratricopeptide (TPR) repeat protein